MQKPFSFQTDITYRASVTATEKQPNGVLVTIELNKLSEHEQPSKATRLIAVIPLAVWAQGPDRIAPMLKLAIASEMNSCFILRSLEHSGKVLVMPKSGVDDTVGVRVIPDLAGVQGTFSGIVESLGRTARVWLDHAASALSAVDGRPEGATKIGAGPIPPPFPYGPGRAARDEWFAKHGQHQHARQFIADLQRQIDSLQALVDMGKQTEVQRLARIASKLSELTGADMPDGATALRLERWICGIQNLNLRRPDIGVVRKAELAAARQVAAVFYSKLGITMPMPSEDDTVTSLAQGIADTAATEIDRRDRACDEARWRIERITSEIERVSGENFGIPVRTDPLLEDYAIRWVSRMRKKMVSSEITKAVVLHGQFPGLRDGVTTEKFLPQDQRKDPIDAFWVGFKLCEQRAAEALRQSFDAGGSALDDESPTEPPASQSLLDLFNVVEFSWDGSGAPIAFPAIRMLPNDRIVGVIDGEVASVEARIASLEFAQSTKAPLRKRWADQGAASLLRFVVDSFEFCTVRSNSKGRTCVSVTLKLSAHDAPLPQREEIPPPDPKPTDVSAEVAAVFADKRNDILTILNPSSGNIVRIMGRIQDSTAQGSGARVLYGAIRGGNKFVTAACNELSDIKNNGTVITVKRLWDPKDSPFKARLVKGTLTTCTPKQPSLEDESEVLVEAELEAEPSNAAQKNLIRIREPGADDFVQMIGTLSDDMELSAYVEAKHHETEEVAAKLQSFLEKTSEVWVYTYPNLDTQGILVRFGFLGFKHGPGKPWKTKLNIDAQLWRVDTVSFSCPTCVTAYAIEREDVAGKEAVVECQRCFDKLCVRADGTTMPCVGPTSSIERAKIFAVPAERSVTPDSLSKMGEHASVVKGAVSRHLLNVETFQQAGQTPDPAKDPQDDPHTVRFHCGTCEKQYTVAREKVATKNIIIKCANCGARLEVTPIGAVVIERGKLDASVAPETKVTVTQFTTFDIVADAHLLTMEMLQHLDIGELSTFRQLLHKAMGGTSESNNRPETLRRPNELGLAALFTADDVFKPSPPDRPQSRCIPAFPVRAQGESSDSNIAAHESSVQIHFEDLSNGEVVNDVAFVAILTRGDNDEDGCRSWSILGSLEGEPEWVSKVQSKLERLNETKGHVMVIVRPRKGEDYTIRAQLYGTNIGPAVPSQYDIGTLVRVKANIYATIIEAKVPRVEPIQAQPSRETDTRDLAPVTPRSERDPADLARIEAQPKNLRTLVEEAHKLLSEFEPAMSVLEMAYTLTVNGQPVDPLLHRIRLLGNAWKATTATMARVLYSHNAKPVVDPEEMAVYHRVAQLMTGQSFETHLLVQPGVRMYFNALRSVLTEVHTDKTAGMSIVLDMLGKKEQERSASGARGTTNSPELEDHLVGTIERACETRHLSWREGIRLILSEMDKAELPKQTRKASFYRPIVLEHERREIPELLFRGKPITPTDPEWAELVATVRVLEAQAFPLVQVTVTGPNVEVGANEMVALATAMERVSPNPIKLEGKVTVHGPTLADVHAAAQMRPEDDETQAALNNVEALLRGTDVDNKEPIPMASSGTDLQPGESVRVTAAEDAFYGMVGEFEAREEDGRYRVRFMKHGGVSIAFARSDIELEPKPEMAGLNHATSLQPDPTATPPITEAEANMARKLDDDHRAYMPIILGLHHDPNTTVSAIVGRDELKKARARELFYVPGELGTNRLAALADMAAKDPQVAEDAAVVAALLDEPIDVFVGPPPSPGPLVITRTEGDPNPKFGNATQSQRDADHAIAMADAIRTKQLTPDAHVLLPILLLEPTAGEFISGLVNVRGSASCTVVYVRLAEGPVARVCVSTLPAPSADVDQPSAR